MKKICALVLCTVLVFLGACEKEKDTRFLITNDSVGKLMRVHLTQELDSIFAQDSIVGVDGFQMNAAKGKHLLTLTQNTEVLPKIQNIRIMDPRFVTDKGIGLASTFKEINDNYTIKRIITTMNNVVIYIKENDLYFTIDKKELPSSLRYSSSTNVEAVQIPDNAKLKYLMMGWD